MCTGHEQTRYRVRILLQLACAPDSMPLGLCAACACRHFLTPGAQAAQPAGKCDLLLGKMAVCGETGLGGISPEVVPATAARWR